MTKTLTLQLALATMLLSAPALRPATAQAQDKAPDAARSPLRGSIVEDRAARKLLEAGDARFDADEQAKAVEVWQSVIERYPRSGVRFEANMRLGNYLLERERAYDRARVHFEAAASQDNSDQEQRAEATLKTGVCFYESRNFGKTFQIMRQVIEQFPTSGQVNQAYYYIGLGHFQLGHYSRAIQSLQRVGTALAKDDKSVEKVEAGKRLFVKIEDADLAALEPGQTVKVQCKTTQGDVETVQCLPVGRNVRLVLGSILTALGKPRPNNGTLEVRGDDKVEVTYMDRHTADKQFNRPVLRTIIVVGDGVVQITDGAYRDSLSGVVLGKEVNVQVTDADHDRSDGADSLTATLAVYRAKTSEEMEAETAKLIAEGKLLPPDAAAPQAVKDAAKAAALAGDTDQPKVDPYKLVDRVKVTLKEAVLPKARPVVIAAPAGQGAAGDAAAAQSAPGSVPANAVPRIPGAGATLPGAGATLPGAGAALPGAGAALPGAGVPGAPEKPLAPDATGKDVKDFAAAVEQEAKDDSIHSGVFRATVPLVKADQAVQGDDTLQALPGDVVKLTYEDQRNSSPDARTLAAKARTVEGNLGGVRVTRTEISDQELRLKTQLKTASALTNIGNRYKEFGLKENANDKYGQALLVCEQIADDARRLGGHILEETYVQLWRIYFEMDKLDLAAAMASRLQREFPNSGFVDEAMLQLALVARKKGDMKRAISVLTRLVNMKTSQLRGEAQFYTAECYEDMAKAATGPQADALYERAFQEYKKVFDQFPDSGRVGEAVAKMANFYYQKQDYARAIDVFETVLQNHPDAKFLDVILFNYGRCLYRMQRKPEARKQFDQLISEFPESPLATDAKRISDALIKGGF